MPEEEEASLADASELESIASEIGGAFSQFHGKFESGNAGICRDEESFAGGVDGEARAAVERGDSDVESSDRGGCCGAGWPQRGECVLALAA